jgi:hypothetical protein
VPSRSPPSYGLTARLCDIYGIILYVRHGVGFDIGALAGALAGMDIEHVKV